LHIVPKVVEDLLKDQTLVCAKPSDPLDETFKKMRKHMFHHLPVVSEESGELIGIITDRDIRTAADSPILNDVEEVAKRLHELEVRQVMNVAVVSVNETAPIVEAAKLMRVSKVGCLPVVREDGKICVGIITRTDLLDQLIRLLEPLK